MKVTISTVIEKPIDEVVFALIDKDEQLQREGYQDIKLIEGIQNTEGSLEMITNQVGTQLSRSVINVNLPHSITYHLHEAHMEFEHHFREHDDHVHYKLIVRSVGNKVFQFLSNFLKRKVERTMNEIVQEFKKYCESK